MNKYIQLLTSILILSLLFSMTSSATSSTTGEPVIPLQQAQSTPQATSHSQAASSMATVSSQPVTVSSVAVSSVVPTASSSIPSASSTTSNSSTSIEQTPNTDSSTPPTSSASSSLSQSSSSDLSSSVSLQQADSTPASESLPSSSQLPPNVPQANPNAPSLVSPPPTEFTSTIYYNSTSPFGIAGSFHLVGFNSISMNAHTNGNALANTLYANANFGTNNLANELSYIQHYSRINGGSATSSDHVLVVGSSNSTELVDNGNAIAVNGTKLDRPKNVWQDSAGTNFIDLAVVKGQVQSLSAGLSGYENYNITANINPQGGSVDESYITLTNPNESAVFNITASQLSTLRYLGIKGFSSSNRASVVVNVDCEYVANLSLPISLITIDNIGINCSETHIFTNGRVIWNFYNLLPNSGTAITASLLHGSVLAPDASFTATQNLNGTVIANDIDIRAESHRDDFVGEMPDPKTTISLVVNKVWLDANGNPLNSQGYSATIQLLQDESAYGAPITLNESNGFTHTYAGLSPDYSYTIQEQSIMHGSNDVTDSFTISSLQTSPTTITLTNRLKNSDPLTLPSTGASADNFLIIGLLMILIPALLFYYNRRTR